VWDAASGRLLRSLDGHKGSVWSVALSADGTTILSGDYGGRKLSWDLATGKRVKTNDRDRATRRAAQRQPPGLSRIDNAIVLTAPDGTLRARLETLPDGHWVTLMPDGLTYTGSEGGEKHMLLVDGMSARPLDDAFIAAHRRNTLPIDWP